MVVSVLKYCSNVKKEERILEGKGIDRSIIISGNNT